MTTDRHGNLRPCKFRLASVPGWHPGYLIEFGARTEWGGDGKPYRENIAIIGEPSQEPEHRGFLQLHVVLLCDLMLPVQGML